ncbi:hypothetical protein [Bacteroides stercoris]|jgi:hypothetical protein|uniref:Uncharacterized protein n=1 Tax=Bacteroides stercoris TaxID=46506 RepID=A0A7J5LPK0_BACSE|nr:hypothetical protein [Bacteroides stercoris]KAB5317959.1 hypothetical protein F9949_10025 [Bacteroides stercoris]KAB5328911.1 hypothetical protein F9950_06320 [Bacteroides stercoris]KAB5335148.1 hypothetical protein F9956_05895 [Bacteroides stercoris]KAB5335221.1 hypothetical protein F9944_07220 [Bacteroides stercoris]
MKNIFKTMLPILAMAACVWASCSDDKDDPTPGKPALPTIAVSEPALSADNAKAVVTVTPSEETEKWYWKCEPKGQSAAAYTAVTGKEEAKLEIPIDMDVTYTLTAYAENETGKSKEVSKEFTFKSEDVMTELVEFEIKNLSAFSMDVVVKKSAKCAKYVIGATPKGYMGTNTTTGEEEYVEIYKEATFIENAETSLNPDESYPMQPYNWSDVSATFTERTLSRYALKDKDISESKGIILRSLEVDEIKMIIAVYALDAEGNSKVYTQEITIPEPEITGQVAVSIDVPKDKIKMRSFEATFTADANCSRIHVGQSSAGLIASNSSKSFADMTEEEICASIVRLGAEVPLAYTGAFSKEFASKDMEPNTSYIVYAIPIDKEGKIGKVVYKSVTTGTPVYDGTGEITSVTFPDQVTPEKLLVDISVNDKVEFVRVLWDMGTGPGSLDLKTIMADEDSRNVHWHEYATADLPKLKTEDNNGGLYITSPGSTYYLRAVTVDKDGKLSEIIDLVAKANKGDNGIQTKAVEEVPSTTDWTGTGALTLSVEGTGSTDAGMYTADLKVTKGNGTKKVYMVKWADEAQPNGIEDFVKELAFFTDFNPNAEPTGAISIVLDENTSEATTTEEFMDEYSAYWGGYARIYVTLDNDGKLSIADWYIYGYGTKNSHN